MKSRVESRTSLMIAAGALLLAGYWMGATRGPTVVAQDADKAEHSMLPMGVSIPNGGGAVIKGRDGFAYVVNSQGLYVKVAKSGEYLRLP